MSNSDCITILKIGAEGGSITLTGTRDENGNELFTLEINEVALLDLLSEEDLEGIPETKPKTASTWQGAIELLDNYAWRKLLPLTIHPDYGELIREEFEKVSLSRPYKMADWYKLFKIAYCEKKSQSL